VLQVVAGTGEVLQVVAGTGEVLQVVAGAGEVLQVVATAAHLQVDQVGPRHVPSRVHALFRQSLSHFS